MRPPRRPLQALPLTVVASLAGAVWACTVERGGLAESAGDAGVRIDAAERDGKSDTAVDAASDDAGDAGPDAGGSPCLEYASPRRLTSLDARLPGEGFLAEGALDGLVVGAQGAISLPLQPHRAGRLLATGYRDALLHPTAPTLQDLDATPTGRAFFDTATMARISGGPASLGIEYDSSHSILLEGQVRLEAGSATVQLSTEDRTVLRIGDLSEGDLIMRTTTAGAIEQRMVGVDRTDWYELRVAMSNSAGASALDLRITDASGTLSELGPDRIRVDATEIPGRELLGWDAGTSSVFPDGAFVDQESTLRSFSGAIRQAGIADNDGWNLRWIGRHLLDDPRAAIHVDADDSHRLWVDGVYLGGTYGGTASVATYPLTLVPGWYDVILELEEVSGSAHANLTYGGNAFTPERMQPRSRFGGLVFGRGVETPLTVDPSTSGDFFISVTAPDEDVNAVDLSVVAEAPSLEGVNVDVIGPRAGSPRVLGLLNDARRVAGEDVWWGRVTTGSRVGSSGQWRFDVSNGSGEPVTIRSAGVLVHAGGVAQPYGTRGSFTSEALELPGVARIEQLDVHQQVPPGTFADLSVRAADDTADLPGREFVPVGPDLGLEQPIEGRVVQVRAVLRGDGRDTPRIHRIGVVGRLCLCERENDCPEPRAREGLVVLYTFDEGSGSTVRDVSGVGDALDLEVSDPTAVEWGVGSLTLLAPTVVSSAGPATKVIDAFMRSSALTVEMWIEPRTMIPEGDPARLLTISLDEIHRNLSIGQGAVGEFQARVRHAAGDDNGAPFLTSGPGLAQERLLHLVYTLGTSGEEHLYLDGSSIASDTRPPDLSGWDATYLLALGNELNGQRGWLGTYYRMAAYDRALDEATIRRHWQRGP